MSREPRSERLEIPASCRQVKPLFPTRERADAALPSIKKHIEETGKPHTWSGHTHTKPAHDSVPVYIGEFSLPERFLKAKRFAPCPCCWPEFGKFGHGMIAWFEAEAVIRLVGPDCFRSLNAEAHEKARKDYEIEQERRRNTEFLLSNLPKLDRVIESVESAIVVAQAIEKFHAELHNKLALAKLNLWPYVRRGGDLVVYAEESEFRRGARGELYTHDVTGQRALANLPGYKMLDPQLPGRSSSLLGILERLTPYLWEEDCREAVNAMSDQEKRTAADKVARGVTRAKEHISEIRNVLRFTERVAINTLRTWGAHPGCPIPYNYAHNGQQITFGKSDYQHLVVRLPEGLQKHIPLIDFWTDRERRRPL